MLTKQHLLQALLRNICLFVVGILLVTFSAEAPKWIVMGCGVLFMLPGLITLFALFTDKDTVYMPMVPLTAGGSILFGVYLLSFPNEFLNFLLVALAGVLIIYGTMGCLAVWRAKRINSQVSLWHYVFPTLLFITGVIVLCLWQEVAQIPFLVIGYALIVYAPLQLITSFIIYRTLKRTISQEEKKTIEADAVES